MTFSSSVVAAVIVGFALLAVVLMIVFETARRGRDAAAEVNADAARRETTAARERLKAAREAELERIRAEVCAHLRGRTSAPCSICQGTKWTVEGPMVMSMLDAYMRDVLPCAWPFMALVCVNCGTTRFVALLKAQECMKRGETPPEEPS